MNPLALAPVALSLLLSPARAGAVPETEISAVFVRADDAQEFRCSMLPSGQLRPDAPSMKAERYQALAYAWDAIKVRLPDLAATREAMQDAAEKRTVFKDNYGGAWAVRLVETKAALQEAACAERDASGGGRCYFLFPAGDFAGYSVLWSRRGAPATVLSVLTKADADRLAAVPKSEAKTHSPGQDFLEKFRRALAW